MDDKTRRKRGLAVGGRAVAIATGLAATVALATAIPAVAAVGGPASGTPAAWTPVLPLTSTTYIIRQLVQCGNTMYAVGSFPTVKRYSASYVRNNAFSFNATTGVMTSWDPNVNGTVNSVALNADCSTAYLGGQFTSVHGTAVKNIAAVNTSTGGVLPGFAHTAGGQVEALVVSGSHVLAGGYFTGINNSPKRYMASLNATTGIDDNYLNLNISGNYVYTDDSGRASNGNGTRVFNYALSPNKSKLLVMGDFTSVGGVGRRQIFMLNLGASSATVDPWYSAEFDANCATVEPFWLQDAAWSPDASTIYIATTGYKPANGVGFSTSGPRGGLCDAAAAFPSTSVSNVVHKWINYAGCDSLFAAAADTNTAYVAGHERWASNPNQCDNNNNGSAVNAPGVVGLSPANGSVVYNPTRGRGLGADDMLVTSAGLWIGSDTAFGTDQCGGQHGHGGICFLPY